MAHPIALNEAAEALETTYDTSDREAVNTVRKKSARTRATRLEFVAAAMTTEQGRAWYFDLLVFCKVFNTPYTEDPYRTAFNCGTNSVGLRILSDIQDAAPDLYLKMVTEGNARR